MTYFYKGHVPMGRHVCVGVCVGEGSGSSHKMSARQEKGLWEGSWGTGGRAATSSVTDITILLQLDLVSCTESLPRHPFSHTTAHKVNSAGPYVC